MELNDFVDGYETFSTLILWNDYGISDSFSIFSRKVKKTTTREYFLINLSWGSMLKHIQFTRYIMKVILQE